MFLCQPIFLNLRHVFEDFLLTALIKKSEYDSKLTKYNMSQLLLLGKFEYTGGPIFKVVLEC